MDLSSISLARNDFPHISKEISYLDSAATTQKPYQVIQRISSFYEKEYATVHRAAYDMSFQATGLYHEARKAVASFINASVDEIVFTKGTTDSLNILADSFSLLIKEGSVILVSALEHHSNLVPWQMAAQRAKATLKQIPLDEQGQIDIIALEKLLLQYPGSIVAVTHCSNVLGNIIPIASIAQLTKKARAYLIVDGAQSIPHTWIDVKKLQCDAFVFSSHKIYGPTGIGILYATKALLEKLPPTRGGGDMVDIVHFEKSSYGPLPIRFEPGTPPIAEAIGLHAALTYIDTLGKENIFAYEASLQRYLRKELENIPEVQLLSKNIDKVPLESFVVSSLHSFDVATMLNVKNVCVRSGNLCCQTLLHHLKQSSVLRISLGIYSSKQDIDRCIAALKSIIHSFGSSVFVSSDK